MSLWLTLCKTGTILRYYLPYVIKHQPHNVSKPILRISSYFSDNKLNIEKHFMANGFFVLAHRASKRGQQMTSAFIYGEDKHQQAGCMLIDGDDIHSKSLVEKVYFSVLPPKIWNQCLLTSLIMNQLHLMHSCRSVANDYFHY